MGVILFLTTARYSTVIKRCFFMKLQKIAGLTASALALGCLLAAPVPGAAAASVSSLEEENVVYSSYYEDGYIIFDTDQLELEIPADGGYACGRIGVVYVEDLYSTISWSSSNMSVATVDNDGYVTAWGTGSAIITARSDGGSVGHCLVTVTQAKKSRLNTSYLYLDIEYNNTQPKSQLYLTEAQAFDNVYQWRSSNPSVATVDRNGVVTGLQEGVATIYANTYRGNTLICTVTVQNNIGRVTLNESRLYLEAIGGQAVLSANIAVATPSSVSVIWTSSNPAVATVDNNGVVTAVGEGEATITASASTGRSDTCKVYTGSVATQKKADAESFFGLGGVFMDLFE